MTFFLIGICKMIEAAADKAQELGTKRERIMRGCQTMKYLFPLILLLGCFRGSLSEEPNPVERGVKRTIRLLVLTQSQWERSGYNRLEDIALSYPVNLAISGDGTACIIPDMVAAVWKEGYAIKCDRWRFRHGL